MSKITDQNNDMRGERGMDELLESHGDKAMEELLKSRTGANMLEIDDDEYLAEVLLSQNNGHKFQRNMNMPQQTPQRLDRVSENASEITGTLPCQCGCEDNDDSLASVRNQFEKSKGHNTTCVHSRFYNQVNTEIESCMPTDGNDQDEFEVEVQSPAKLLDQLLASQGGPLLESKAVKNPDVMDRSELAPHS